MSGTVISDLSPDQFAQRIADLFPRGWSSDDAKQPGGTVYAVFLAAAEQMRTVLAEIQYAASAQRIQTETAPELDLASIDYLGELFPRPPGMSDSAYSQAIIAKLFQAAATRPALSAAIASLTGVTPRMLEPWSIFDTGVWGRNSYWGVDTPDNPARWGSGGLRYQGFIETVPAAIPAIGPNNPILTWGTAYWNVPGYFFGIIASSATESVYDLINRLRAYGTTVWVKIVRGAPAAAGVAPQPATSVTATPTGSDRVSISWTPPAIGTAPFSFTIQYRVQGTTNWAAGPTAPNSPAVVLNLQSFTTYEFEVITFNSASSSTSAIVTATTAKAAPTPALNLRATQVQAFAVTLLWDPPAIGTPPFTYTVNYRVTGTTAWTSLAVGAGTIGLTVINLQPLTSYDFEVLTTNT